MDALMTTWCSFFWRKYWSVEGGRPIEQGSDVAHLPHDGGEAVGEYGQAITPVRMPRRNFGDICLVGGPLGALAVDDDDALGRLAGGWQPQALVPVVGAGPHGHRAGLAEGLEQRPYGLIEGDGLFQCLEKFSCRDSGADVGFSLFVSEYRYEDVEGPCAVDGVQVGEVLGPGDAAVGCGGAGAGMCRWWCDPGQEVRLVVAHDALLMLHLVEDGLEEGLAAAALGGDNNFIGYRI